MKKKLIYVTDQTILRSILVSFNHQVNVEQMDDLTQHQYAHNSLLAMTKDWNLFIEFCQQRNVQALPASVTATRLFLETEAKIRKYSTIRRYSVTIGLIHTLLSQKDPTNNPQVRQTLMSLRINKKGDQSQATSFTGKHLSILFDKYHKHTSVKLLRDLAIYHVMFECALKRSELKRLKYSQININESDVWIELGEYQYRLSNNAAICLSNWLNRLDDNKSESIVFRSIDRHGNISHGQLDDSSIYRILRNAGQLIGDPGLKFSGQSARIGAVEELSKQGYKTRQIQEFGRWLSPAMPYQYIGNANSAEIEKLKFFSFKPWE